MECWKLKEMMQTYRRTSHDCKETKSEPNGGLGNEARWPKVGADGLLSCSQSALVEAAVTATQLTKQLTLEPSPASDAQANMDLNMQY